MTVEVEFNWPLSSGATLVVEASGYWHACDDLHNVKLAFITPESAHAADLLAEIERECSAIYEHAAISLYERARELLNESKGAYA